MRFAHKLDKWLDLLAATVELISLKSHTVEKQKTHTCWNTAINEANFTMWTSHCRGLSRVVEGARMEVVVWSTDCEALWGKCVTLTSLDIVNSQRNLTWVKTSTPHTALDLRETMKSAVVSFQSRLLRLIGQFSRCQCSAIHNHYQKRLVFAKLYVIIEMLDCKVRLRAKI